MAGSGGIGCRQRDESAEQHGQDQSRYFQRHRGLQTGCPIRSRAGADMKPQNSAVTPSSSLSSPFPPVDVADYARLAPSHLSPMAWEYISGGAGDEATLRWNESAYEKIRLRPRNLVDVSHIDTKLTLFGHDLECPILLAPVAYQRLAHDDGELATVKGAETAGATMVLSTFSTVSLEEVA